MAFVPATEWIGPAGGPCGLVLHGIFGSRRNWTGFARRLVQGGIPGRIGVVDLRGHGGSAAAPPPHTLRECGRDLDRLIDGLETAPAWVAGHSFGGKAALAWLRETKHRPAHLFSLDSPPGPGPAGGGSISQSHVGRMLAVLRRLPARIPRRTAAASVLRSAGLPEAVASWMATNLVHDAGGGYRWHFDLAAVEALLDDYWQEDLRPVALHPPPPSRVHLVRAVQSDRWSREDLDWLERASGPRTRVVSLEGAGHWLHVDRPEALAALLLDSLAPPAG